MNKYYYDGPVMKFSACVESHFKSTTYAKSEKAARNNFAYQYKKKAGLVAGSHITIPGKIIETT